MDTENPNLFPTPMATVKAVPKHERFDVLSKLMASKVEGLDVAFVRKVLEFRSSSVLRWPPYTPEPLPKDVKVHLFFGNRDWAKLKQPYFATQGFDRFCEGGRAQISEHVLPLDFKAPPESPTHKFKGMSKAWEFHFRFMHTPSIWAEVQKRCLDLIGMF